jgi:hypothetical protein
MSKQDESWPAPLKTEPRPAGAALREYEQETSETPSEAAAYGRVLARLERPRALWRWAWALGTTAIAFSSLLLLWPWRPTTATISGSPGSLATSPVPEPMVARPVQLGSVPVTLPAGHVDLGLGVSATLSNDGRATARLQDGTMDIVLAKGVIFLRVLPREVGQAVLVTAGHHLFSVVGTDFRLAYDADHLQLLVFKGLVAVSSTGEHVATVAEGEHWEAFPAAPSPMLPHPQNRAPRVARRTSEQGCDRFTGDQGPQKIACLRELARKGGPEGERAQNALGRYLRDDMADPTAALAAFEAQRARYPRGELRADADRAIIGLLPRLGRHAEALVETQSFLDAQPEAEDRAEIRLLRGDIYRAIFQDTISAEREYEEGAEAKGRTGDDSRFLHALCLEALGRTNEARLAYRDYLAQPGTVHAREAQRRMERLLQ